MGNIFAFLRSCVDNDSEIVEGLIENNETESNISDHIEELFQYLNNIEDDSTDEEFPYNPFGFEEELPSYPSEIDQYLPVNPFGDEEELSNYPSEDEEYFPVNPFGDEEELPPYPIGVEEDYPIFPIEDDDEAFPAYPYEELPIEVEEEFPIYPLEIKEQFPLLDNELAVLHQG